MLKIRPVFYALLASACLAGNANAADSSSSIADRLALEDMVQDYYAQLGSADPVYEKWFVDEGVLDVNGAVSRGGQAIEDLYKRIIASRSKPGGRKGTIRMLLTNLRLTMNGDAATGRMYWTEIMSDTITSAPQVLEYGHETAEFVKRDGRWFYKVRTVTSDGGMPDSQLKTWTKR